MPYTPDPLPTYTFKNGAVATVHRIGEFTIGSISAGAQLAFPPVPIPTFDVDDLKNQPNPADPEYQLAVARRNGKVNMRTMDGMIELGIDIEIDHAALDRIKATMEMIGAPLQELSDKLAYIKHCCILDVKTEMDALGKLLRGELEEATAAATATFSGDVPGPTAQPLERAA